MKINATGAANAAGNSPAPELRRGDDVVAEADRNLGFILKEREKNILLRIKGVSKVTSTHTTSCKKKMRPLA